VGVPRIFENEKFGSKDMSLESPGKSLPHPPPSHPKLAYIYVPFYNFAPPPRFSTLLSCHKRQKITHQRR
jgi:hypothetical protein